jgi:hypothetical protein
VPALSDDELRRAIESADRHARDQRAEAARLEAQLSGLNERLGRARVAQERLQTSRLAGLTGRLRFWRRRT